MRAGAEPLPKSSDVHPGTPALQHRVLESEGLRQLSPAAWDALSANALVENPFYARQFVLAGLETIDRGAGRAGLHRYRRNGQPPGSLPLPQCGRSTGAFRRRFWRRQQIPVLRHSAGAPDHAGQVVAEWLDQMAAGRPHGNWTLPDIDMQTPLVELILDGTMTHRLSARPVTPYRRAFLTRLPGGFEAHLQTVLSKNRLKDVRRTLRRLQAIGTITLEHAGDAAKLQQRLEDFLRLEHAGWKGKRGTSHLSKPEDAAFARRAYCQAGFAAIDSLLLDGEPIAMKLSIRTGDTIFTPKIAYDERHRKLGPGMALEYLLIEEFYRSGQPGAVDAAATAEEHSALNFFNGEKSMATLVLGRRRWQVRLLGWLLETRERLKHRVKALLRRG